jgi:DNA-binding XRE family transcriptional regulator
MKPYERAKAWRQRLSLSVDELAELTGYTKQAIWKFEAGARNIKRKEPHSEWTWQRYQMACAGAAAQLKSGRAFEW